jgi:hypothetical protein
LFHPHSKEIVLMRRFLFVCLVASCCLAACEGSRNNTSWSDRKEDEKVVPVLDQKAPAEAATPDSASADTTQTIH